MSAAAALLTAKDLDQFPNDGKRREIIGGELYVSPAPAEDHQNLSMILSHFLYETINVSGAGKAYASPVDVWFSETDRVQPDLLAIRADNLGIYEGGQTVHGAPDIVVEILSPSSENYDRIEKRQLYEMHGVPEYWIVDPKRHMLTILRLTDVGYVEIEPENGLLRSTAITEFSVDVATLFAKVLPDRS
jgi:Uma2 family endonuclease